MYRISWSPASVNSQRAGLRRARSSPSAHRFPRTPSRLRPVIAHAREQLHRRRPCFSGTIDLRRLHRQRHRRHQLQWIRLYSPSSSASCDSTGFLDRELVIVYRNAQRQLTSGGGNGKIASAGRATALSLPPESTLSNFAALALGFVCFFALSRPSARAATSARRYPRSISREPPACPAIRRPPKIPRRPPVRGGLACAATGIATSSANARSIRLRTCVHFPHCRRGFASPLLWQLLAQSRNFFPGCGQRLAPLPRDPVPARTLPPTPIPASAAFNAGAIVVCTSGNRAGQRRHRLGQQLRVEFPRFAFLVLRSQKYRPPEKRIPEKRRCPLRAVLRVPLHPDLDVVFPHSGETLFAGNSTRIRGVAVAGADHCGAVPASLSTPAALPRFVRETFWVGRRRHRLRSQNSARLVMPVSGMCCRPIR